MAILNFQYFFKNAKHKNACISKTVLDRVISTKFLTHRVPPELLIQISKFFGGHFQFSNFSQKSQYKNACISKTVPDRANSAIFLIHRVFLKTSLSKFQRIFYLPKMVAILNIRIFFRNAKHKNVCISKTMLDRAISTKFLTHRVTAAK